MTHSSSTGSVSSNAHQAVSGRDDLVCFSGNGLDVFDSPFVDEQFVRAADGRICDGPVEQVVQDGYRLAFESKRSAPALGAAVATYWAHGYGPVGGGFLDRAALHQRSEKGFHHALDAMAEQSQADLMVWPFFPLQAREFGWLRTWLQEKQGWGQNALFSVLRRHQRAFLDCRPDAEAIKLSRNKRKVLGRQSRRLSELGDVRFLSTREGVDPEWALEVFLKVEASGWKARKGTALAVKEPLKAFAHDFLPSMLADGRADIDLMMLDHDCIGALICLRAGRGLFTWKTGMDEVYKRFSPGVHVLLDVSRKALADPDIDYVDSLADAGHPVAEHLWTGRRDYALLLLPLNRYGRLAALSYGASMAGKEQARYWLKRSIGRA